MLPVFLATLFFDIQANADVWVKDFNPNRIFERKKKGVIPESIMNGVSSGMQRGQGEMRKVTFRL
jgi:hypothetical protein